MTNQENYISWLIRKIAGRDAKRGSYIKLMMHLYSRDFYSPIPLDENRSLDGISLRKKFDNEFGTNLYFELRNKPCSILELMVSLAEKVEVNFFGTMNFDDGIDFFWTMIVNLSLDRMDDICYDEVYVNGVIDRFLSRNYGPNGEGSLFLYFGNCNFDICNAEIWVQLQQYLRSLE